ncbi:hypothetical protein SCUCBS95973_005549 [Sporothrix curviconia]|uniref:Major facilitator superfamily (MFS) profile domain-containing protein n=1 Tax=Sporothrix curviconia TaxID=1260050 RepID=A0ABP0BXW8_9PEZI
MGFLTGYSKITGKPLIRLVGLTCSVAFILFGYEQGVMGGVISGSAFTEQFPSINTTSGNGNSTLQGFVVAVYSLGCWLGSLLCAVFADRLGRKRTVLVGETILICGTAIQCSAFGLPQLIVGRIITGLGNGMITSTIPVWHSELLRAQSRGRFITTELSTNVGGVAVAYWVDYGLSFCKGPIQWRLPIALQIVFALSTISLISLLPETPRWLLNHDRDEDAMEVLARLYAQDEAGTAERERVAIVTAIAQERLAQEQLGGKSALRMVFTNRGQRTFHRTCLGVGAQVMQQLSGINLVSYYATFIFVTSIGFSERLSSLMSGILSIFFYGATWIPVILIDRVGRRPLLMTGSVGMAIGMFVLAGTASVGTFATGVVATVFLFWYNFWFGAGWIPGPWLLTAEYAPLMTRTQSAAISSSTSWIFTFLVAMTTPVAINSIGSKTYIIYGMFNVVSIAIVYFLYPETKGKTLEQIDLIFSGPKVLMHATVEELEELQRQEIATAIAENRIGVSADKAVALGHIRPEDA